MEMNLSNASGKYVSGFTCKEKKIKCVRPLLKYPAQSKLAWRYSGRYPNTAISFLRPSMTGTCTIKINKTNAVKNSNMIFYQALQPDTVCAACSQRLLQLHDNNKILYDLNYYNIILVHHIISADIYYKTRYLIFFSACCQLLCCSIFCSCFLVGSK